MFTEMFSLWVRAASSSRGGFGGLSPPKQSSKPPQIKIWNIRNQWHFC